MMTQMGKRRDLADACAHAAARSTFRHALAGSAAARADVGLAAEPKHRAGRTPLGPRVGQLDPESSSGDEQRGGESEEEGKGQGKTSPRIPGVRESLAFNQTTKLSLTAVTHYRKG
eukprot:1785375-Pyramimonas_sp.AAC.1